MTKAKAKLRLVKSGGEKTLYYKLVRVNKSSPAKLSFIMKSESIEYKKDISTRPKTYGGPLCVYSAPSCNPRYTSYIDQLEEYVEVWYCTIEPSEEKYVWTSAGVGLPLSDFSPKTVLADSVTLTKLLGTTTVLEALIAFG